MTAGDFIQRGGSIRVQDVSSNDKIILDSSSGDIFVEKQAMKNPDTDIVYEKGVYVDASAGEFIKDYNPDDFESYGIQKLINGDILAIMDNNKHIYRSSDKGNSWYQLPDTPFIKATYAPYAVLSTGDILCLDNTSNNAIWISSDGGFSWTEYSDNAGFGNIKLTRFGLCVLPDDTIILVGGQEKESGTDINYNFVWKLEYGQKRFTLQTSGAEFIPTRNNVTFNSGYTIFNCFGGVSNDNSKLYKSNDKGKTWEFVTDMVPITEGRYGVSAVAFNNKLYLSGGRNKGDGTIEYSDVWMSEDGGYNWSKIDNIPIDYTVNSSTLIPYEPSTLIRLCTASRNTLKQLRSDDEGRSWYELTANWDTTLGNDSNYSIPSIIQLSDGQLILLNRKDSITSVYSSPDNGNNWYKISDAPLNYNRFGHPCMLKTSDDTIFLLGGRLGSDSLEKKLIYKSTDKGRTWTVSNTSLHKELRYLQGIVLSDDTILYAGGFNAVDSNYETEIYESTDKGTTFTYVGDLPNANSSTYGKLVKLSDDTILYFGASSKVYQSTDKARTWTEINSQFTEGYGTINSVNISVTVNDVIYIHQGQNSVSNNVAKSFVSYDKGYTFTEISQSGNSLENAATIALSNEILIVGGNYRATDTRINTVTKIPLQSIEDFRTTGITHLAYDLNAGTLRESGVKLEDKYLKKQGTNVVNGEMILKGGNVRLERPVDALPMSEPELRYPPDLDGATLADGTAIDGTTAVSTDINNPTQVVVSGQPYGNGTYGFVCGSANIDRNASRNLFNAMSSSLTSFFQSVSAANNFNPFDVNYNKNRDITFVILYPKAVNITKVDIQCNGVETDRFMGEVIVYGGNNNEYSTWDLIDTINVSDTFDGELHTFNITNTSYYKNYGYVLFVGSTKTKSDGPEVEVTGENIDTKIFHPYGHSDTLGLQYPPAPLTSNSTTITGQTYGNGVYQVRQTSSWRATNNLGYRAFDGTNTIAGTWTSSAGKVTFSIANEPAIGTPNSLYPNYGFDVCGEGVMIEMPEDVTITQYRIRSRSPSASSRNEPRSWILYGSHDGYTWSQVDTRENQPIPKVPGEYLGNYTVSSPNSYKHYAMLVTSVNRTTETSGTWAGIAELQLFGLPTLDKLYRFPPRALTENDIIQSSDYLTGSAVIEGEAYGNGEYKVYVSGIYNNKYGNAIKTFIPYDSNNVTGTSYPSKDIETGSKTYNTFTHTNYLVEDYKGEWIIYEFPQMIYLSNIIINSTSVESIITDFKFYGSNDRVNWNEVYSDAGNTDSTKNLLIHTRKAYKYIGLVVSKINSDNDYFWIKDVTFYGTPLDSALIQSDANSQTLQLAPQPNGRVIVGKAGVENTANKPVLEVNGNIVVSDTPTGDVKIQAPRFNEGGQLLKDKYTLQGTTTDLSGRVDTLENENFINEADGDARYLQQSGDEMSGSLIVGGDNDNGVRFLTFNNEQYIQAGNNGGNSKLFISQWKSTTNVATFDLVNSRVGIGTTNPGVKLEVDGDVYANDNIRSQRGSDHTQLTYSGVEFNRITSYLRSTLPDATASLNVGFAGGNQRWKDIFFESLDSTFKGDVDVTGNVTATTISSFTGCHIVYTSENHTTHEGLIVSSTGQIPNITINDALPYIALANTPNDKRVFGVLGDVQTKKTQYNVNSLGEGAIWVSDINGSLENGDYITSSVIPGYGQCQDDDLLHNYTVAKITMDCDFSQPQKAKLIPKKEIIETQVEREVKDESGNVVYEDVAVLDESGNEIVDESGNVVYERKAEMETITETTEEEVLDENGKLVWIEELDASGNVVMEPAYEMRYLQIDGVEITKEEYETRRASGDMMVYRAAFVGCTYHCG